MGYTAVAVVFTPCMIIYSLAYGGLASLQEPIRADYFGTKAFATIQGMSRKRHHGRHFHGPDHRRLSLRSDQELHDCVRDICRRQASASAFCMFLAKPPAREQLESMESQAKMFA